MTYHYNYQYDFSLYHFFNVYLIQFDVTGCKQCEVFVYPRFDQAAMEELVNGAIEFFIKKVKNEHVPKKSEIKRGPPHMSDLCERCRSGYPCSA